jgi:hypothetical protein
MDYFVIFQIFWIILVWVNFVRLNKPVNSCVDVRPCTNTFPKVYTTVLQQTNLHTWLSPLRSTYMYKKPIQKLLYDTTFSSGLYPLKPTCSCLYCLSCLTCMTSRWKSSSTYPISWIKFLCDPTLSTSILGWNLFTQPVRSPHSSVRKIPSSLLRFSL